MDQKNNQSNCLREQSGQTLIEAIVAMAVILIALIGFLSQSLYNFSASNETAHRRTAFNLAREAIEVSRQIRDSNWLKGCVDPDDFDKCYLWNTGLSHGTNHLAFPQFDLIDKKWKLNFKSIAFDDCVSNTECALYKSADGFYFTNESEGKESDYFRQLELKPLCLDETECGGDGICDEGQACSGEQNGYQVVSRVRWQEGNDWRNVILINNLYNWR